MSVQGDTKATCWWGHSGILFLCLTYLFLQGSGAQAGTTTRVSVDSDGNQANGRSFAASLSADGRFVAFDSYADNLVPNDTNGGQDVFVHDRQTGRTTRVSVNSDGNEGNDDSFFPNVSADGRFVAFQSTATNLVPNDTNDQRDVFVHDRQTGQTTLVSIDSAGNQANGFTYGAALSADSRFVAFVSDANNLVPNDTNGGLDDIFVHDRQTGITTRVSVDSTGNQANGSSFNPSLSADGRFVAFRSFADNLVPNDTNGSRSSDVFVHDRQTGRIMLASVDSAGNQGTDGDDTYTKASLAISAEGRFVAFLSSADNLVPNDTNNTLDVFVHDRQTGVTTRVNVDSAGNQAEGWSRNRLSLSADGRFVAFDSNADNLVPNNPIGRDTFVHDRQTGITTLVSGKSEEAWLSADGRFVAFRSLADNLVPDDTNDQYDIFVHDRELLAVQTVRTRDFQAPNVPENTLDQDLDTRWSARGDGQWIRYDLGSRQTVNEVRIAWFRGDQRQAHFDIEVSRDASTWTEVFSGSSSRSGLGLERYRFTDITGRYVRIVGHGNTENDWNSITEVKIHRN